MESARRGRPATVGASVDDDSSRSPDPMLPHGDSLLVIRDALLSQLQKDRLRQEIILVELGKIECALALGSADSERAKPAAPFAFNKQVSHGRGSVDPERDVDVDEVHDPKKKDEAHGRVERESEKPATADLVDECLRTSGGNGKAAGQENAAPDESSETMLPKKTFPSSVKWTCSICQVKATSQGNLREHFAGQKHWSKVASLVSKNNAKSQKAKETAEKSGNALSMWACRFCQSNCTCQSDLENHMKGKRHQRNIRALMEECKNMESNYASPKVKSDLNNVPQDEEGRAPTWICSLCQARCTRQSELENHLRGKRHRLNFLLLQEEEAKLYLSLSFCEVCNLQCNSEKMLAHHRTGKKHLAKLNGC